MIAVAREAVQTAEDARAITVKKMEQERLDNERQSRRRRAGQDPGTSRRRDPAERASSVRPGPSGTR